MHNTLIRRQRWRGGESEFGSKACAYSRHFLITIANAIFPVARLSHSYFCIYAQVYTYRELGSPFLTCKRCAHEECGFYSFPGPLALVFSLVVRASGFVQHVWPPSRPVEVKCESGARSCGNLSRMYHLILPVKRAKRDYNW